ncbi:hypothetical protein [Micromonospora carbonacea]|uniref:hypothetical protein n=1 Tax=Micromonospora carbonacea TaxID=47853 RepID=UPI00114CE631|nr:hypothetical protein [Micromonospora carbonacea]
MTYSHNPQQPRKPSIQAVTGLFMLAFMILFLGGLAISARFGDSGHRAALAVSSSPPPIARPTTTPTTPEPSATPTPRLLAAPKHTTSAPRTTKPAPARPPGDTPGLWI